MKQNKSKGIKLLLLIALIGLGAWLVVSATTGSSLTERLTNLIDSGRAKLNQASSNLPGGSSPEEKQVAYTFAILSDTHESTTVYPQIVNLIAARQDLRFVTHLGDFANAGDLRKLQQAKTILDQLPQTTYVIPGDHDLNWYPQHDLSNFKKVFGVNRTYYSFDIENQHFIFIDSSDLNNGLSPAQWEWLRADLDKNADRQIYVFMSTPISNPYLSFKSLGSENQLVADQAKELGQLLDKYQVQAIFAGDTHTFSQYKDPDTGLNIITVGSAGSNKNLLPLYLTVDIFTDGSYNVTSIPLDQDQNR